MPVGGSIESISFDGREFAVAADNEGQLYIGGYENESLPNGNETARLIKSRKLCGINGLQISVDFSLGDPEFLQDLADLKTYKVLAVTLADGSTYQCSAQISGELQFSTQSSTASISFSGPGKMTKQKQ